MEQLNKSSLLSNTTTILLAISVFVINVIKLNHAFLFFILLVYMFYALKRKQFSVMDSKSSAKLYMILNKGMYAVVLCILHNGKYCVQ